MADKRFGHHGFNGQGHVGGRRPALSVSVFKVHLRYPGVDFAGNLALAGGAVVALPRGCVAINRAVIPAHRVNSGGNPVINFICLISILDARWSLPRV